MICAFCILRSSSISWSTKNILPYSLLNVLKFYFVVLELMPLESGFVRIVS